MLTQKQILNCSIDGCDRPAAWKELCIAHYRRSKRGTDMSVPVKAWTRHDPVCSVDGCDRPHDGLGYCQMHRRRFNKYGDPLKVTFVFREQCTVNGCDKPHAAHGYCAMHLGRAEYGTRIGDGRTRSQEKADLLQEVIDMAWGLTGEEMMQMAGVKNASHFMRRLVEHNAPESVRAKIRPLSSRESVERRRRARQRRRVNAAR